MKILNNIIKFFLAEKIYSRPKESKIIILDNNFEDVLRNFKYKYKTLDIRLNQLNIYILFICLLKYKKISLLNYIKEFLIASNCKVILTFNDNNEIFYKLKNQLPEIKTIAVQNGFRNKLFFNLINKNSKADLIFTLDDKISYQYKKKIKSKFITLGSFKNNFFKKKKIKKQRNSILFISHGYPKKNAFHKDYYNRFKYSLEHYLKNDLKIVLTLSEYCEKNNLSLEIFGRGPDYKNEKIYYEKLLKKKIIFHDKNKKNIYYLSDETLLTVSTSSTFGIEALARGNRVAIFNCRGQLTKGIYDIFWYQNYKKKKLFWTNSTDKKEIYRTLNFSLKSSKNMWQKKTKFLKKDLMGFSPKNFIFYKNIKNFI